MKKERLQIVYACNDRVFDCLFLSILSIVKRTKTPIDFYIFSADLTELDKKYKILSQKHLLILKTLILKYNSENTISLVDCKENYYKRSKGKLPDTRHGTPYTSFRLLFDMFNFINGNVLYLDTDTMACGDINNAFKVKMAKYEICVTRDIYIGDSRLGNKYFNAGVLLMNIDMIRQTKYLEKAFKYLQEKKPQFCDQDALNGTGKYIKYRSSDDFNRIKEGRMESTLIKHFAGPCKKPGNRNFIRAAKKLNYSVGLDDINEGKQMKRKTRGFNKYK